jgi:hypothetical protein
MVADDLEIMPKAQSPSHFRLVKYAFFFTPMIDR